MIIDLNVVEELGLEVVANPLNSPLKPLNEDSKNTVIDLDGTPEEVERELLKLKDVTTEYKTVKKKVESNPDNTTLLRRYKDLQKVVSDKLDTLDNLYSKAVVIRSSVNALKSNADDELERILRNVTTTNVRNDQITVLKRKLKEYNDSSLPNDVKSEAINEIHRMLGKLDGRMKTYKEEIDKYFRIFKNRKNENELMEVSEADTAAHEKKLEQLTAKKVSLRRPKGTVKDDESITVLMDLTLSNIVKNISKLKGLLGMSIQQLKKSSFDGYVDRMIEVYKLPEDEATRLVKNGIRKGVLAILPMTAYQKLTQINNAKEVSSNDKKNFQKLNELYQIIFEMLDYDPSKENDKQKIVNIVNMSAEALKEFLKPYELDISYYKDNRNEQLKLVYISLYWTKLLYGINIDVSYMNLPELSEEDAMEYMRLPTRDAIELIINDVDMLISMEKGRYKKLRTGEDAVDLAMKLYRYSDEQKAKIKAEDKEIFNYVGKMIDYDPTKVVNLIVVSYIDRAIAIAKNVCKALNQLNDFEDAVQFAMLGLTQAVQKWEEMQREYNDNVPFETYVDSCVDHAVRSNLKRLANSIINPSTAASSFTAKRAEALQRYATIPGIDTFISKEDFIKQTIGHGSYTVNTIRAADMNTSTDDEGNTIDTFAYEISKKHSQEESVVITNEEMSVIFSLLEEWAISGNKRKNIILLNMYMDNKTQVEIAQELELSQPTISAKLKSLEETLKKAFKKLNITNKDDASRVMKAVSYWLNPDLMDSKRKQKSSQQILKQALDGKHDGETRAIL
jgi:RNA polymerase sigma-B factor